MVHDVPLISGQRLLIIGDASSDARRHRFARQVKGVEIVERADMPDLGNFARKLTKDATPEELLDEGLAFAKSIMTQVEIKPLRNRLASLLAKRSDNPAEPHEAAALEFLSSPTPGGMTAFLGASERRQGCRVFRYDLYHAAMEMLASARGFGELPRRAAAIIERRRFSNRGLPRRALGSTLLLKGLEADHVVVLEADKLDARHLYVALTRGARTVTIHSPTQVLTPSAP